MTSIQSLVPKPELLEVAELVRALGEPSHAAVFEPETVDAIGEFGNRILRDADARRFPELSVLGFWLRPARLRELSGDLAVNGESRLLVPRGVVLHIPPSNVDTMFVYSWALAALCGCRNVVRVSDRRTEVAEILVRILSDLFASAPDLRVARNTWFVSYGHELSVTEQISVASDLRVIWGGDVAVKAIRAASLAPRGVDLTFPNRRSAAILRSSTVSVLDAVSLRRLAGELFVDAYWFDQRGCSSPQSIFWVGDADATIEARNRLWLAVGEEVRTRSYRTEPAVAFSKEVASMFEAAVGAAESISCRSASLMTVEMADGNPPADGISWPGGGYFRERRLTALHDIAQWTDRRDQTLAYFGFSREEMRALAKGLAGTAFDRMVPIGKALEFDVIWDGYDLLQQFTRIVTIR